MCALLRLITTCLQFHLKVHICGLPTTVLHSYIPIWKIYYYTTRWWVPKITPGDPHMKSDTFTNWQSTGLVLLSRPIICSRISYCINLENIVHAAQSLIFLKRPITERLTPKEILQEWHFRKPIAYSTDLGVTLAAIIREKIQNCICVWTGNYGITIIVADTKRISGKDCSNSCGRTGHPPIIRELNNFCLLEWQVKPHKKIWPSFLKCGDSL